MDKNIIKAGDYVVIQRQGYTKLHKLKEKGTISLGHFIVELDNVLNEKYFDSFQMKLKEGTKKFYTLEKTSAMNTMKEVNIEKSGIDNRHIKDDGTSQLLTKDDLTKLRDESISSNEILEKLVTNSKTFASKTEYSQEKYLKKKEKKYFDYIHLRRPTIRILAQMFYRQDPAKTLGIRVDDLSQILCYANVQSEGNYVLFDSGTSGLITAAILNRIGANTSGKLIHVHPGNECQKNAVLAMQFTDEHLQRCVNVNLYSVLRAHHQNKLVEDNTVESEIAIEQEAVTEDGLNGEPLAKKRKLSDVADSSEAAKKKPCWQIENEKACNILENKVDSIIVIAKEHPVNIVKELIPFLGPSRTLVVFSLLKEPLQDMYMFLKSSGDFINLKLSNNFMRQYQVLPERTHPVVNMNSGGYILYGNKVC